MHPTRPGPPVTDAPGPPFYGGPDTPVCKQIKKGGRFHFTNPHRPGQSSAQHGHERKKKKMERRLLCATPSPRPRRRGAGETSSSRRRRGRGGADPLRRVEGRRKHDRLRPLLPAEPLGLEGGAPPPPSDAGPQLVTFVRSPAETRPPRGQHGHVSRPRAVCPWGPNPAERPWAPGGALGVPTGHQVPESP